MRGRLTNPWAGARRGRLGRLALVLSVLGVAIAGALAVGASARQQHAVERALDAELTAATIHALLDSVRATEAEVRGFIVTGDRDFLAATSGATVAADEALLALARIPGQPVMAAALDRAVEAKLAYQRRILEVAARDPGDAAGMVASGTGVRLMDTVESTAAPFLASAAITRAVSRAEARRWARVERLAIGGSSALAAAVIFAVTAVFLRRGAAHRRVVESRLRLIVEHAPVAILGFDGRGRLVVAQGRRLRDAGVRPGDSEPPDALRPLLWRALAGTGSEELVEQGRVCLAARGEPVLDAHHRVMGALVVAMDVTERVRAERLARDAAEDARRAATEARRAQAEIDAHAKALDNANRALARTNAELARFAHFASHDLREPLRTIEGMHRLLARRLAGRVDADTLELFELARGAAERAQGMIRDHLARAERGRVARQPVDLAEVVAAVTRDLRGSIEEAGATVERGALPEVLGDAGQLRIVFQNLFSNSLKYRRDEPLRIRVTASRESTFWHVAVRDNGRGLDPALGERIFGGHREDAGGGAGSGLEICRRIVEAHGGWIWAEGAPGVGATVHLTLPRARGAEGRVNTPRPG